MKKISVLEIPIMRHSKTRNDIPDNEEINSILQTIQEYQKGGNKIEIVISSPAIRCLKPAEHISQTLNIPLITIPELAPICTPSLPSLFNGNLYRLFRELPVVSQIVIRAWSHGLLPFSESYQDYLSRSKAALNIIFTTKNPVIIAHAETIIAFLSFLKKINFKEAAKVPVPHNKIILLF